jgi:hypothetical protein
MVAPMVELSAYTLSLQDSWFIHQLVVDTYAASHVTPEQKPISINFALIGLYLVYEKGFTGRQVQRVHMNLANKRKSWVKFDSPTQTWPITVEDVLKAPEGEKRNEMIKKWGKSVWEIWKGKHLKEIETLIKPLLD